MDRGPRQPTSIQLLYGPRPPAAHVDTVTLWTEAPGSPRRYSYPMDRGSRQPASIQLLYGPRLPAAHVDTVTLWTEAPGSPRRYSYSMDRGPRQPTSIQLLYGPRLPAARVDRPTARKRLTQPTRHRLVDHHDVRSGPLTRIRTSSSSLQSLEPFSHQVVTAVHA